MPTSLESARPIMAPSAHTSVRFSTYSMAPSYAPTVRTTDSATAEIQTIEKGLDRMENKALQQQRVVLNEEKTAVFQKLALGAKLDRALDRRMTGQDAEMRLPRTKKTEETFNEKEKN
ncbi:hypothetical protein SPBR_03324 [Sporothrix brasiliensis 5110]|uniref:Uncharacterized protein n=1 Tax=Sporothrix brasiliensis 5110 TaxID=1398154 RepID=A0A0C2EZR4_9PEZI|nr:uncharacterized protein SPBR_03324 [Sporothrix brasiliensis 5110]KIH92034.1 hypothetical protein SPBR_03324 [Sporothrix brasiliensis 5110]